jgi:hypothetical protein
MAQTPVERAEAGRACRHAAPLEAHGEWRPPAGREDPLVILARSNVGRLADLVPIRLCGRALARAHARTGDAIAIAAYLGDDDTFDRAIARFAVRYADQTQADYHRLEAATAAGEIDAEPGR